MVIIGITIYYLYLCIINVKQQRHKYTIINLKYARL